MNERKKIEVITRVLKRKFSNLSATDTIKLSYDILEAIEELNKEEQKNESQS